jgi:hypothetical protein
MKPMVEGRAKAPFVLSTLIAALAVFASAGGLFLDGTYRDNTWVTSAWRGNDAVTLGLAVPLLVASMLRSRLGSLRARLVWLGMLAYTLYGYAFYLFGAAFNRFFLVYAALLALSILALLSTLGRMDVEAVASRFRAGASVRWIAGYMLLTAAGIGGAWVASCLAFVFEGTIPQVITASGHPTGIVFAVDLSLLVPFMALGAIELWRRRPWGYVLGVIMNVKGATYTLALAIGSALAERAGVANAAAEIPLWLSFSALSTVAALLLLGRLPG